MLKKALMVGQNIANAHPADVRLLFKKYGISVEPTGKTILDAYLVYGKPFLMQLIEIGYKPAEIKASSTTGLEGGYLTDTSLTSTLQPMTTTTDKDKASIADGVTNWFDGATKVLTAGSGLFNMISTIFGGKPIATGATNADAATQQAYLQAKLEAQQAEANNSTKTYLLIGAGILVAVLVAIMFLKKK